MRPSTARAAGSTDLSRPHCPTELTQLMEELPTGLLVADVKGRLVLANRYARQLLEPPGSELVGAAIAEVIAPLDRLAEIARAGKDRLAIQTQNAAGKAITIGFQIAKIEGASGEGRVHEDSWAVVFRDITQFVMVREERSRLVDLAARVLQNASTQDGDTPFGLVDCLQLAAMGGHSVTIEISTSGTVVGVVVVVSGALWSVWDDDGEGSDALLRLVRRTEANVVCRTLAGDPGPQNVERPWEELILEAARRADEAAKGMAPINDFEGDCDPELDPGETSDDVFGRAMERGLEAMLVRDYAAAFSAFQEAQRVRPDDKTVQANLSRLKELDERTR